MDTASTHAPESGRSIMSSLFFLRCNHSYNPYWTVSEPSSKEVDSARASRFEPMELSPFFWFLNKQADERSKE